jgi:hypothetical protein
MESVLQRDLLGELVQDMRGEHILKVAFRSIFPNEAIRFKEQKIFGADEAVALH